MSIPHSHTPTTSRFPWLAIESKELRTLKGGNNATLTLNNLKKSLTLTFTSGKKSYLSRANLMCSNRSKAKNLPKGGKGERIGWRGAIAEDYLQDPAVCRAWKLKANKNISAEYLLKYRRILSRKS